MEFKEIKFKDTNIKIIDGDRGKNYPKKSEMFDKGHTLFLNNKNIINDYLDVSHGEYITEEKCKALRKGKLNREDIVMSTRGSVGNIGYFSNSIINEHIRINSGMVIFRNEDENIDTTFLYHLLKSDLMKNRYREMISGSVQNQLPIRDIENIKLTLPPKNIQTKIAEIIQVIEEKLFINSGIIKNLESIANTVFESWFINFEFPNEQGLPYRSSLGEMVESELGEIPKGWIVGTAGDLFEFSPTVKLSKGTEAPFVEMKNLNTSAMIFDWTNREFTGSGSKFKGGDTLLARITPCLENGKIGYVDFLNEDEIGWGSTEFISIRSKGGIDKTFSYFFANSKAFKDYAVANMNGSSGRQRVKAETLAQYAMPLPPSELINQFTNVSSKNMKMMTALKNEIISLQQLRDILLPKLLSGEIEI